MSDIKSVLMVCTGNSCRSVMAEGMLKKRLKELDKADIKVSSAGVGTINGMQPSYETIEVMRKEGVDVSDYRSRRLTDDLIKKSDLILVMEEGHIHEVVRRVPEAISKTHLLKTFGLKSSDQMPNPIEIPDPIGRPFKDYEACIEAIRREVERIAKLL